MLNILSKCVQLIIKKHLFCDTEVQTITLINEFDFVPDPVTKDKDDDKSNSRWQLRMCLFSGFVEI